MPRPSRCFVITGSMGSGKTPLIEALAMDGFLGVAEPARAVIAEQGIVDGLKIYDRDKQLFLDLMLERSLGDFAEHADARRPVLFDRGLPDLIAYARLFGLDAAPAESAARAHRYNGLVFVLPSWREIYVTDEDRRMTFEQAAAFGDAVRDIYTDLGYTPVDVPRATIAERAAFVRDRI